MAKRKNAPKAAKKRIVANGVTYHCSKKKDRVTVSSTRTAQGQKLVAGVLNLTTKEWHNDNKASLPDNVRSMILDCFASW